MDEKKLFRAPLPILTIGLLRGGYGFLTYGAAIKKIGDFKGYLEVLGFAGKSYIGKLQNGQDYKVVFLFSLPHNDYPSHYLGGSHYSADYINIGTILFTPLFNKHFYTSEYYIKSFDFLFNRRNK